MAREKKEKKVYVPKRNQKFEQLKGLVDEGKTAVEIMLLMNLKSAHTLTSMAYGASCFYNTLMKINISNKSLGFVKRLRNQANAELGGNAARSDIDSKALKMLASQIESI